MHLFQKPNNTPCPANVTDSSGENCSFQTKERAHDWRAEFWPHFTSRNVLMLVSLFDLVFSKVILTGGFIAVHLSFSDVLANEAFLCVATLIFSLFLKSSL